MDQIHRIGPLRICINVGTVLLLFYLCYLLSNKSGIWKRTLITVRANKLKNVEFEGKTI